MSQDEDLARQGETHDQPEEESIGFADLIRSDRATRASKRWDGTFIDYLALVRAEPGLARLAHSRVYEMIMRKGSREISESDDSPAARLFKNNPIRVFDFFAEEFFGIEKTIAQIARYFHAASLKGEESRQVLYLMGPVGSGKSSLAEKLHVALEAADPIYVIADCPMHEEPLHLLPRHLRPEFEKMLGVRIEGDLCPVCRYRLAHDHEGRYEEMRVTTVRFSKRNRIGIGVVPPVDPNNQDTSVLIGSEDISKLDRYSEGDPRVLDLNGALNVGNRGIVEFIEVFKNETEYLHAMITATQEKSIPAPGRHGMIYVDECIVAHSNEAEWNRFRADHTNEAILDRIVVVKVPYNLRLSEEMRIYEKILDRSDFRGHIAPHTIELASMFAILSRLEPTAKCDPMTKMRLYNGEEIVEGGRTKKVDVDELRSEIKREGMFGTSTRFIMKALDNALSDSPEGITPIHILETMIRTVKESDVPDDDKTRYLELLQGTLHKAFLKILEREITKAFVFAYEEQAEALFANYLDHAEAFVNHGTVTDANTHQALVPDEAFMKSIEEHIAITGSAAIGFRQEVIGFLWASTRRGRPVSYTCYEPLRDAIEKKLMNSVRDISRIITLARTRDKDQREKYDALVANLIDSGYTPYSAEIILRYAANNLWKD